MNTRKILMAASAVAATLMAGTAHAGADVQWQVTLETPKLRLPGHVVLPLPPIPVPRAVVVAPQREERRPVYADARRWDADGDGIPNRYDRVYNPRWDRDGDGIPNRDDARPDDPRNSRGWHEREERRDDRRDGRKDWRDDRRH